MPFVADTSPVRALASLSLVHLFQDLYGKVLVPPAVAVELRRPTRYGASVEIASIPALQLCPAPDPSMLRHLEPELDAGELQAIGLAMERNATLLLIDERKATAIARGLGVDCVGVAGILLEAKHCKLVPAVVPLIDRLRNQFGFFVSAEFRSLLIAISGE
jgi:hypothetical protein